MREDDLTAFRGDDFLPLLERDELFDYRIAL